MLSQQLRFQILTAFSALCYVGSIFPFSFLVKQRGHSKTGFLGWLKIYFSIAIKFFQESFDSFLLKRSLADIIEASCNNETVNIDSLISKCKLKREAVV